VKPTRYIFATAAFALTLLLAGAMTAGLARAQEPAAPAVPPIASPDYCGTWVNGLWVPSGRCGIDPACGAFVNGTWTPNGLCKVERRDSVTGTITIVKGHLVTLQRSKDTIVINDQPALNAQTTGRVAVGRQIVAAGYWRDAVFYATSITSPPEQGSGT